MRIKLIEEFLNFNKLGHAARLPLPQDASFRRYERIVYKDKSYILMDAPPEKESTKEFAIIDGLLRSMGLSAPQIYAHDEKHGLMLLEDFGDLSFNKFLASTDANTAIEYYRLGAELLTSLQSHPISIELPAYNWDLYKRELEQFTEYYVPVILGDKLSSQAIADFYGIWQDLLDQYIKLEQVLVLRDYHADNIHILPARQGISKLGIIDFQDAVLGSPAYDLVSLLEDARRKVSEAETVAALSSYLREKDGDYQTQFRAEYVLLGAQRNLKILGIFSRKAYLEDRKNYAAFLPTVLGYIRGNFHSPLLNPLADWFKQVGLARDLRLEVIY